MVNVIDTRPQGLELKGYSGDTLSFNIVTDYDYTTWAFSGEVRSNHTDDVTDAVFTIGTTVPGTAPSTWTTPVALSATATKALADLVVESPVVPAEVVKIGAVEFTKSSVPTYSGVWDIQVKLGDVVKTLVQGTITIDQDITRTI